MLQGKEPPWYLSTNYKYNLFGWSNPRTFKKIAHKGERLEALIMDTMHDDDESEDDIEIEAGNKKSDQDDDSEEEENTPLESVIAKIPPTGRTSPLASSASGASSSSSSSTSSSSSSSSSSNSSPKSTPPFSGTGIADYTGPIDTYFQRQGKPKKMEKLEKEKKERTKKNKKKKKRSGSDLSSEEGLSDEAAEQTAQKLHQAQRENTKARKKAKKDKDPAKGKDSDPSKMLFYFSESQ